MADDNKRTNNYGNHLYIQMSKTYYSYKKPGDGKAFTSMYIQDHDGMITLKFHKQVTSENKQDINCYLPAGKVWALSRILEGMMGRRRDAYDKGENYDPSESWTIPTTAWRGGGDGGQGQEVSTGKLLIDTEMYDGVPKLRFTYTDFEKDQSVEFVFNSRVPSGDITGSLGLNFKLDFADIDAYNFVNALSKAIDPTVEAMYRIVDGATNSLMRYMSACFRNLGITNNRPQNNGSSYQQSYGGGSDENYEAF